MGGLPDRRVVHVEVAADGPHHHLARVEPDANLDGNALGAANLVGIVPHRLLHAQGGVAGTHGVILVGEGRAEEGHDAVAHDLVHRAFVVVDGVHHVLEHGIEELARLLGIAIGEQLHGALEVGEEHRHLLTLALEGGAGGEDLLREVPRRVGLGRCEARLGGAGGIDGPPALAAEAHAFPELGAAPGALAPESRPGSADNAWQPFVDTARGSARGLDESSPPGNRGSITLTLRNARLTFLRQCRPRNVSPTPCGSSASASPARAPPSSTSWGRAGRCIASAPRRRCPLSPFVSPATGDGAPSARSTRRASPRPTCTATSTSTATCSPPSTCARSSAPPT